MLCLVALALVTQLSAEPPETTALRAQIDTGLISVNQVGWQTTLRQGERSFSLSDEDWSTAFALVPESQALARSLKESYDFGMTMFRVGIAIELGGLLGAGGLAVMALVIGTAVLPVATIVVLALVCAGLGLAGAIVAVIGVPALMRAQGQTLELVSTYNHALTRQPVQQPGLVIPLGL